MIWMLCTNLDLSNSVSIVLKLIWLFSYVFKLLLVTPKWNSVFILYLYVEFTVVILCVVCLDSWRMWRWDTAPSSRVEEFGTSPDKATATYSTINESQPDGWTFPKSGLILWHGRQTVHGSKLYIIFLRCSIHCVNMLYLSDYNSTK